MTEYTLGAPGRLALDYAQLRASAQQITARAGEVRAALSALQAVVGTLPPVWQGRARAAFDTAWQQCDRELAHTPRMLDQMAATLMDTAQRVQTAEQQAVGQIHQTVVDDMR
jgi:WXG100 family type VII secretion target